MRRYHHLGIPTTKPRLGERYLPALRMFVSGFDTSPFGVEWMRFEEGSPVPQLVQQIPHVAFEVDDLEAELEGHEVIIAPTSPSDGIRVAFVVHDGAPVEFIEIHHGDDPNGLYQAERGGK
jgi:hypothetical protein